jgi:hypothetical protein
MKAGNALERLPEGRTMRDSFLRKARALQAMTTAAGCTAAEAANAATALDSLMEQHAFTVGDLLGIASSNVKIARVNLSTQSGTCHPAYHVTGEVCRLFGLEPLITREGKTFTLALIGFDSRVQDAKSLFCRIIGDMGNQWSLFMAEEGFLPHEFNQANTNFFFGMVAGLKERFAALIVQQQQESDGTDLVPCSSWEVQRALDEMKCNQQEEDAPEDKESEADLDIFSAGMEAADKIRLLAELEANKLLAG